MTSFWRACNAGKQASDLDFDGGEAELTGGDCGFEGADDDGVELCAGKRLDALESEVEVHGGLVRTIGGDGVESVGDADNAGHERNLGRSQAVRIATAVHVFMV